MSGIYEVMRPFSVFDCDFCGDKEIPSSLCFAHHAKVYKGFHLCERCITKVQRGRIERLNDPEKRFMRILGRLSRDRLLLPAEIGKVAKAICVFHRRRSLYCHEKLNAMYRGKWLLKTDLYSDSYAINVKYLLEFWQGVEKKQLKGAELELALLYLSLGDKNAIRTATSRNPNFIRGRKKAYSGNHHKHP